MNDFLDYVRQIEERYELSYFNALVVANRNLNVRLEIYHAWLLSLPQWWTLFVPERFARKVFNRRYPLRV